MHNKNLDLIVTTMVIGGSPKSSILKEAKTFGTDLNIVGSHDLLAIEGFLLGSVSQTGAGHRECSVEIVRK